MQLPAIRRIVDESRITRMRSSTSLQRMVALMDRWTMPRASELTLSPVCVAIDADVSINEMDADEARAIMGEIDAKSSALLAVLAIILATSAFVFSLDQTWATLALTAGIDVKIVSERLDHSSTHITREIYTHVTPPMQSDAAERVAQRVFGTESQ